MNTYQKSINNNDLLAILKKVEKGENDNIFIMNDFYRVKVVDNTDEYDGISVIEDFIGYSNTKGGVDYCVYISYIHSGLTIYDPSSKIFDDFISVMYTPLSCGPDVTCRPSVRVYRGDIEIDNFFYIRDCHYKNDGIKAIKLDTKMSSLSGNIIIPAINIYL